MATTSQAEKPISKGQIETLKVFKKHLDDGKNDSREGWLIADQAGVNLLSIRALETRGLLEVAYKGSDWSTLPYRITEKGLRALVDPESVLSLTPDMEKALKRISEHDERMRAECGSETWVAPYILNIHENTMRALEKRGLVELRFGTRVGIGACRITEKGREYVKRKTSEK